MYKTAKRGFTKDLQNPVCIPHKHAYLYTCLGYCIPLILYSVSAGVGRRVLTLYDIHCVCDCPFICVYTYGLFVGTAAGQRVIVGKGPRNGFCVERTEKNIATVVRPTNHKFSVKLNGKKVLKT